jgi:hypothetical protein
VVLFKYDQSNLKWVENNNGIEDVYFDNPATYLCKLNDNAIASIENKRMYIIPMVKSTYGIHCIGK